MQAHLKCSSGSARRDSGLGRGCLAQHLLHRLALCRRQIGYGLPQAMRTSLPFHYTESRLRKVRAGLQVLRCIQLSGMQAPLTTKRVQGAMADDSAQPGIERTARIVGETHLVDRQQHLLHHVVDTAGHDAVPACCRPYEREAVAQQGVIGCAITILSCGHPSRAPSLALSAGIVIRSRNGPRGAGITHWDVTAERARANKDYPGCDRASSPARHGLLSA